MSRIRADKLVDRNATGAPQFTYGVELPVGYGITGAGNVNVSVYNLLGQVVSTLQRTHLLLQEHLRPILPHKAGRILLQKTAQNRAVFVFLNRVFRSMQPDGSNSALRHSMVVVLASRRDGERMPCCRKGSQYQDSLRSLYLGGSAY